MLQVTIFPPQMGFACDECLKRELNLGSECRVTRETWSRGDVIRAKCRPPGEAGILSGETVTLRGTASPEIIQEEALTTDPEASG